MLTVAPTLMEALTLMVALTLLAALADVSLIGTHHPSICRGVCMDTLGAARRCDRYTARRGTLVFQRRAFSLFVVWFLAFLL